MKIRNILSHLSGLPRDIEKIYIYIREIEIIHVYMYMERDYEELAHLNMEPKSHNCCLKARDPGKLVI